MQLLYTDPQLHCNPYKNSDKIFSLYLETLIHNFMREMFGILAQFIDAQIIYEKARCQNKKQFQTIPQNLLLLLAGGSDGESPVRACTQTPLSEVYVTHKLIGHNIYL